MNMLGDHGAVQVSVQRNAERFGFTRQNESGGSEKKRPARKQPVSVTVSRRGKT
jgi:hypothetical protein